MKRKPLSRDQSVLFEEHTVFNPMTQTVTEHLTLAKEYFVVSMALCGSAFLAFFCVWHSIRVVNRKFNCIDNADLGCLIRCQKGDL